jgi:hypothetical protein
MTTTTDSSAAREWWASLTQDQRDLYILKQDYREVAAARDIWRNYAQQLVKLCEVASNAKGESLYGAPIVNEVRTQLRELAKRNEVRK